MELLNRKQAADLFQKESVLIGGRDVVPRVRVKELFGEKAWEAVEETQNDLWNVWYFRDLSVTYVTARGFERVVSYVNARLLSAAERRTDE